jgi:signal transduction histidine kinase
MKDTKKYFPEMLDEIKNETIKLNALIDSLIQLSNTDVLKSNESISIFSLVNDVLNDCKDLLSQKQLKVIVDIPKNATLNADKNYAYIFLSNLIGNAIKYNKKKGSIHLSYSQ